MSVAPLQCSSCRRTIPVEVLNTDEFVPCDCGYKNKAFAFPAFIRPPEKGARPESVLMDDEASCFFHEANRAEVPCDGCGRFLCTLCDIEMEDQHLCPECVAKGKKKGKLQTMQSEGTLYDNLALIWAVLPIFTLFGTIVTAPVALFVVFRYWKEPNGLIPRSKMRFVLAALIALAELAAWIVFFTLLFLDM